MPELYAIIPTTFRMSIIIACCKIIPAICSYSFFLTAERLPFSKIRTARLVMEKQAVTSLIV